jgi:hypothetical protein
MQLMPAMISLAVNEYDENEKLFKPKKYQK